ncbi:ACP S-malonyltransferase [Arthrospira platensis]|uniref:Malonyl CoA-acyl carrier protein transacylase n=1 Tax=Limnospira platensis NIES-46 TaxID=1236695 RepID=A0A5M3TA44_LIMPL|nr:ACP S-malonyltransferase [Arthrospira platensis]AMW30533.1 malonyl CoA-ACP transacylase [Arthrospira platensis YZ]KDR57449.1 malonyl CoA-ACP transacylase [Arthrospira platensis str. Paraca]MBD2671465.1 ACP S-malonyltransferase [Arthrospira platensis FACHB-439]MBD2712509.1 ACP S-malonyltransferase [Arthrospira platensis FACHB-835]MDF2207510.1 ACP S-malonyltransferase [Arthrospira platensis NCB002]MDT9185081.1 ACP S-malonyltransferase [Limnospira sp. PMC 289.06]MDT9297368.1 ACP S-malonyltra
MTKTAWVFPGQGSQAVGMGADLFDSPDAQPKLNKAADILGWSLPDLCQGEADKLSRTLYTQPCLYVVESLLVDALKKQGKTPDLVAGHSLGEYVALYAAGVFDFEAGLRLVKHRAELMDKAAGGQMAALIGFNAEQLNQQLEQSENVVLANDNSSAQVVISGTPEAVDNLLSKIKVKRAVKLNVSGAFHSPLMAEAATQFQQVLDLVNFQQATVPVLSNVDPTPATDGEILKERLVKQMTGSVRWREICLQLSEQGIQKVIEVGPGQVLTGLIKRTCSGLTLENCDRILPS